MKKGKLIVIEGPDGCGKSTQCTLLVKKLKSEGKSVKFIHFPNYNSFYGEMISEFLRGEFGGVEEVHPKLVGLLFGLDRKDYIHELQRCLRVFDYVILDRYVTSNIVYQGSKFFKTAEELEDQWSVQYQKYVDLSKWILDFEYVMNSLPSPDLEVVLTVPMDFIEGNLNERRESESRDYLEGQNDIHEVSSLQKIVSKLYSLQYTLNKLDCSDGHGKMLPPEEISNTLLHFVKTA